MTVHIIICLQFNSSSVYQDQPIYVNGKKTRRKNLLKSCNNCRVFKNKAKL